MTALPPRGNLIHIWVRILPFAATLVPLCVGCAPTVATDAGLGLDDWITSSDETGAATGAGDATGVAGAAILTDGTAGSGDGSDAAGSSESGADDEGASPGLDLSETALDFGAEGWTRAFKATNTGGGTLDFSISSDVDWLVIEPAAGAVTSEAAVIEVRIDRNPLVVGAHEAELTVCTNAGHPVTITVKAEKPLTSPILIPWVELPFPDDDSIAFVADGLRAWRRVTDTAMVTTSPSREWLFEELRAQVPDMTVIPSVKTVYRLGESSFDSLSGWQAIADSVADAAAASGVPIVLLENETALIKYWHDEADIDLEQLRECLRLLPDDVQIIWYPTTVPWSPEAQIKWSELAQVVEDELDCRFVDGSFAYRWWYEGAPLWTEARELLESFAEEPTLPVVCFGCFGDTCFWNYDETLEIMDILAGRPDTLIYPGYTRWVESAEAIADELWQDAGDP